MKNYEDSFTNLFGNVVCTWYAQNTFSIQTANDNEVVYNTYYLYDALKNDFNYREQVRKFILFDTQRFDLYQLGIMIELHQESPTLGKVMVRKFDPEYPFKEPQVLVPGEFVPWDEELFSKGVLRTLRHSFVKNLGLAPELMQSLEPMWPYKISSQRVFGQLKPMLEVEHRKASTPQFSNIFRGTHPEFKTIEMHRYFFRVLNPQNLLYVRNPNGCTMFESAKYIYDLSTSGISGHAYVYPQPLPLKYSWEHVNSPTDLNFLNQLLKKDEDESERYGSLEVENKAPPKGPQSLTQIPDLKFYWDQLTLNWHYRRYRHPAERPSMVHFDTIKMVTAEDALTGMAFAQLCDNINGTFRFTLSQEHLLIANYLHLFRPTDFFPVELVTKVKSFNYGHIDSKVADHVLDILELLWHSYLVANYQPNSFDYNYLRYSVVGLEAMYSFLNYCKTNEIAKAQLAMILTRVLKQMEFQIKAIKNLKDYELKNARAFLTSADVITGLQFTRFMLMNITSKNEQRQQKITPNDLN